MSEPANTYLSELNKAMLLLAECPNTLFVGQAVKYPGQAAFKSFDGIPMDRRIEMPVAEDFQMGFCTGLALEGYIPVSFYTRWDFLILAMNQLVNHLDKLPMMGWNPKVIIRTSVGRKEPLDPGPQHCQNYTLAVRSMLKTVAVLNIEKTEDVIPSYQYALSCRHSVVLVEHMRLY
jgi:pyruvate/2-oxoglutarate/acetoin dehydrogenase E1 component